MDHNLEDSLTLEGMDFDHSEDVVNQEDIPLEDSDRLDSIAMDMDVGEQSHDLMETVNDEVIVSDLIEDPFPFQEYIIPTTTTSHNLVIDPHQLNQLTVQHDPGISMQYAETLLKQPTAGPAKSNMVTVKVAQPRSAKRVVSTAPLRQVAIAPKPVPTKPVQYAIAPKPMTLLTTKQTVGMNKIPISSSGNVKGNTVLAQIGRQLVMVPKKIKLMQGSAEGMISSSTSGLQYQVACTSEQAQLMTKGPKPMVKFIQIQSQSSADKSSNPAVFTKVTPANAAGRARYVMQQKTVPLSIGGNQVVQNVKIASKKKIIAIKSQNPKVQASQGNASTKKVVITSNAISNQKVLIRTNAPTTTSAAIKDTSGTGQRTQFHPINVPGKGIQYIKLVTNQSAQKPTTKTVVPGKNFVFTDSKGNIIQMTAEKVVPNQPQSANIVVQGTAASTKGVVKTMKAQKKLVRIAPVSKAASQTVSQPARSSQSLLAPITSNASESTAAMTSLPSLTSPVTSPVVTETINQQFNDNDASNGKAQQSYGLANYVDNSKYETNESENDLSTGEFVTEYSTEDASQLNDETAEEVDPDETDDVKPTLQSLISDAVSEDRESDNEMENTEEVTVEFENKSDVLRDASFMLREDSNIEHDTSGLNNEESIIIVPGSNYTHKANESLYSDDSQSYRVSREDRKNIPLLSVEAECIPYTDHIQMESPSSPSTQDEQATTSLEMRPRKACNCTKSQCLKLYCDCFANGEFCNNCNCNNCNNNLENEEIRQKAIRSCLERNPNAFRPKIGKSKTGGPEIIRRHTKGCNCKRSGCLKNYCECYEAKIACTSMCKCVGCRNVEETLVRRRDAMRLREKLNDTAYRPAPPVGPAKQPCSFMTMEVIEAVCQCLVAAGGERAKDPSQAVHDVIEEFARCLQDVITASHHTL